MSTYLHEQFGEPRPPGALGPLRVHVLGKEVVRDDQRPAEPAEEPVERVAGAHAKGVRVGEVHHPVDRLQPIGGEPDPVSFGPGAGQAERVAEHRPRVLPVGARRRPEHGDGRRGAAGEPGEVFDQRAEEHLPALGHRLELVLPVVAGDEAAGHHPQDGAAAAASLDQELVGDEAAVLGPPAAVGEAPRRLPRGHGGLRGVVAEGRADRAALAGLDLVPSEEPGVDARAGGDRLPYLLGRRGEVDLVAPLEFVAHRHGASVSVASAVMAGWIAMITRWSRPASALSSWYLPISVVTALASSWAKAARSAAVAKRTWPSIAKVARRLRALVAPTISVPTSCTSRPATASSQRADSRSGERAGSGATAASAAGEMTYENAVARSTRSVMLPLRRSSITAMSNMPEASHRQVLLSRQTLLSERVVERLRQDGRVDVMRLTWKFT